VNRWSSCCHACGADRLLLQRLKRSKSQTLLWGDGAPPLPAPGQGLDSPGGGGGPPATSAAAPAPGIPAVDATPFMSWGSQCLQNFIRIR
jgi:hypothetical protein